MFKCSHEDIVEIEAVSCMQRGASSKRRWYLGKMSRVILTNEHACIGTRAFIQTEQLGYDSNLARVGASGKKDCLLIILQSWTQRGFGQMDKYRQTTTVTPPPICFVVRVFRIIGNCNTCSSYVCSINVEVSCTPANLSFGEFVGVYILSNMFSTNNKYY